MRLFISYRRADERDRAGRLNDRLIDRFGQENVFFDVDSILPGMDFREVIHDTIAQSDVVLALIGARWDAAKLLEPNDFVRMELEEAFRQHKVVIPVLVGEMVEMPSSSTLPESLSQLSFLNARRLRPDPDFRHDSSQLIDSIPRAVEALTQRRQAEQLRATEEARVAEERAEAEQARASEEARIAEQRAEAEQARSAEKEAQAERAAEHAQPTQLGTSTMAATGSVVAGSSVSAPSREVNDASASIEAETPRTSDRQGADTGSAREPPIDRAPVPPGTQPRTVLEARASSGEAEDIARPVTTGSAPLRKNKRRRVIVVLALGGVAILIGSLAFLRNRGPGDGPYSLVESRLDGHIGGVSWSPDGSQYVASGDGQNLTLYDAAGEEIRELGPFQLSYLDGYALRWAPDGQRIGVLAEGGVYVIDPRAPVSSQIATPVVPEGVAYKFDLGPDGLVVVSGQTELSLWDADKPGERQTTLASTLHFGVAFNVDGTAVAAGPPGPPQLRMWNASDQWREGSTLVDPSTGEWASVLAWSPTGTMLVAGMEDSTVRLISAESGSETRTLKGAAGVITDVRFTPDSQFVWSVSHGDQSLDLWRVRDGKHVAHITPQDAIASASVSPDGSTLLVGTQGAGIEVYQRDSE